MKIYYYSFFLILLTCQKNSFAQSKAWVFFNSKNDSLFNPTTYFNPNTILKRTNAKIPLIQFTDLEVNPSFIDSLKKQNVEIKSISRWLNAACVIGDSIKIVNLKNLFSFINSINFTNQNIPQLISSSKSAAGELKNEKLRQRQMELMHEQYFNKKNLSGQGVIVAVFDGGFPEVDKHKFFENTNKKNKILATYNFVKKNENVFCGIGHGRAVLSNICGVFENKKLGLANNANLLLAITEKNTEPFSEEENWLAAAEWADKNGADIINSSLGYTNKRYFQTQMNGSYSLVSKAANIAASKGILVFISAGNEGDNSWKFICTPADADSVITVGAINPKTELHYFFSSYGIAENKKVKPNICAPGNTMVASSNNSISNMLGTSFSSPLAAGFAACILEENPNYKGKPMELKKYLEQNSSLFPYYDLAHGYGQLMPEEIKKLHINDSATFTSEIQSDKINILPIKTDSIIEYFYWKLLDKNNEIIRYQVIETQNSNSFSIELKDASSIELFYKGFYQKITLDKN